MSGIDNITAGILSDAQKKADGILAEAKEKAAGIVKAAENDAAAAVQKAADRADTDASAYAARVESQMQLKKRQTLLRARQEVIDSVIAEAYDTLAAQDTEPYFEMLTKLVKSHVRPAEGVLKLSAKDLSRMPEGFFEDAAKAAKAAGGSLTLSEEAADIENGLLLIYGGIEENCTLKSLFAEKEEVLRDKVHAVLF